MYPRKALPAFSAARPFVEYLSPSERVTVMDASTEPLETLIRSAARRDTLTRRNYRRKRIQKGKPWRKTKETDAIFANVRGVRQEVRDDAGTLEISADTKAKGAVGDYGRGGKKPDGRGGGS